MLIKIRLIKYKKFLNDKYCLKLLNIYASIMLFSCYFLRVIVYQYVRFKNTFPRSCSNLTYRLGDLKFNLKRLQYLSILINHCTCLRWYCGLKWVTPLNRDHRSSQCGKKPDRSDIRKVLVSSFPSHLKKKKLYVHTRGEYYEEIKLEK